MKRVMVDIETMSLRPNALVRSIGAVVMTNDKHEPSLFFAALDAKQYPTDGTFHIDPGTMAFWGEQPPEAHAQFANPMDPRQAVLDFGVFMRDTDEIWANGVAFDLPALEHVMRYFGGTMQWRYDAVRDYRTMRKLFPVEYTRPPELIDHHALYDARAQAEELRLIFTKAGISW